jgi:hypothetical protein
MGAAWTGLATERSGSCDVARRDGRGVDRFGDGAVWQL